MRADIRWRLAGFVALVVAAAPARVAAQAVDSTNYDEVYAKYLSAPAVPPRRTAGCG
jgi:hypothetical protein